jgi:DNA-binding CsgD family transcriptional regulator
MSFMEGQTIWAAVQNSRVAALAIVVALQALAALYFLVDSVYDSKDASSSGVSFEIVMDGFIALALLSGIIIALWNLRYLLADMQKTRDTLAVARGAVAGQIATQCAKWGLTQGEADVALFALKGCSIAEIAILRDVAQGTVRAQLSQIYTKAGVTSQSMLVSQFIEDLIPVPDAQ